MSSYEYFQDQAGTMMMRRNLSSGRWSTRLPDDRKWLPMRREEAEKFAGCRIGAPERRSRAIDRTEAHGRDLLAVFPNAGERDPIKLCKRLRRLEVKMKNAVRLIFYCAISQESYDAIKDQVTARANAILGTDRVWVDSNPQGYAIKMCLTPGEHLCQGRDGCGIIAPEIDGR